MKVTGRPMCKVTWKLTRRRRSRVQSGPGQDRPEQGCHLPPKLDRLGPYEDQLACAGPAAVEEDPKKIVQMPMEVGDNPVNWRWVAACMSTWSGKLREGGYRCLGSRVRTGQEG